MTRFSKNSITFRVSNEVMAQNNAMAEAINQAVAEAFSTDPEVIARRQTAARQAAERSRAALRETQAAHQTLCDAHAGNPTTLAVLALHKPTDGYAGPACDGDDIDGYDAETPAWPCRTIEAIQEATK